jgi:hypothetical protein
MAAEGLEMPSAITAVRLLILTGDVPGDGVARHGGGAARERALE